ncbi:acyl-protein synthetase [Microcoleus sp. FACHB-1515]|uniref:hypothetical protein n=1 Tax=Cyanophyceae TaxID=3028117 RepID=UPI0019C2B543|nr:hypothetical protein [Microcoleus sp. FACHB-1515]MBD2089050.1 acyl-protein synthetase [Microcoleus sp. FACHB-1515]
MLSIEQLTEQIMLLSSSDRALLAQRIIESLSFDNDRYTEANSLFNEALRLAKLYQYRAAREKLRQAKQLFAAIGLDDMVEKCNRSINEIN